jgi:uncharacterized membrane protein YbhN (UPF0104 family)
VRALRVSRNLERSWSGIAVLVLVAAVLFVGALAGLSWVAGFGAVEHALTQVRWPWLLASAGGMVVAFVGYRLAYEGVDRVGGGPTLSRGERSAVVIAGFGGFIARGGSAVDKFALEAKGTSGREAKVRVAGLDSLEHVPIAIGGCAAAIALLAAGLHGHPPADFVWPWAIAPPVGGVIAVWLARRYRKRWRTASGWRGTVGIGLDGVWMLFDLIRERTAYGLPYVGMCLFWAADVFALWAALSAFGFRMGVAALIIAYAIGYALTRRSAPLGGAGLIETTLPLTLWDSGAPLSAAVAGVLAYRFFNLWLPMPASFAVLPRLNSLTKARRSKREKRGTLLGAARRWMTGDHLDHTSRILALSVAVAALLATAALVGVAAPAGYSKLGHLVVHASWMWFPIALGAEAVAYVGYTLAYREVARIDDGHPLPLPRLLALVATGFGLFIPRGGFSADYHAFVDAGFARREARLRVLGLGALEYAVLAPFTAAAAIFVLTTAGVVPRSFTLPWAIAVPAGFGAAVVLLPRRKRWHRAKGWRNWLARALDPVALICRLALQPRDHGVVAVGGMALYWAADIAGLGLCLRGFLGHSPSLAALLIGYATGYALTRRTLPFAGAGAVEALLPFALYWVKIPLAPAILAVFAYRLFNLWLPLIPALAGRHHMQHDDGAVDEPTHRERAAKKSRRSSRTSSSGARR